MWLNIYKYLQSTDLGRGASCFGFAVLTWRHESGQFPIHSKCSWPIWFHQCFKQIQHYCSPNGLKMTDGNRRSADATDCRLRTVIAENSQPLHMRRTYTDQRSFSLNIRPSIVTWFSSTYVRHFYFTTCRETVMILLRKRVVTEPLDFFIISILGVNIYNYNYFRLLIIHVVITCSNLCFLLWYVFKAENYVHADSFLFLQTIRGIMNR